MLFCCVGKDLTFRTYSGWSSLTFGCSRLGLFSDLVLLDQDEFSRLSRNASLGVHGYILVFSIGSRQSYEMIGQVNDALLSSLGDLPDVPRVLVGTMKDLSESKRQVSTLDGQRLADSWGGPYRGKGIPYIEVSSKTGENVADVFHTLLKEIEKEDGYLAESESGGCTIQ